MNTKKEIIRKRFEDILKRYQRTHEKNLVDIDEVNAYCLDFIDAGIESQAVLAMMSPDGLFRKRLDLRRRGIEFDMLNILDKLPTSFVEEQKKKILDWGVSIVDLVKFMSPDYIERHMEDLIEEGLSYKEFVKILFDDNEKYWLCWNKETLRDRAPSMDDLQFFNNLVAA